MILRKIVLLLLPLFLLLGITLSQTFTLSYYTDSFEANNITEATGLGSEELEKVAIELIRYLGGLRSDLIFDVTDLKGGVTQAFEDRELLHMVDVRKIFDPIRIFIMAYPLFLVAVIYSAYKRKNLKQLMISAAKYVVYPSLVLLVVLVAAMTIDFNGAFILFHKLFFRNDLWLLNPDTDLLIQMLPEVFFINIVKRILFGFGAVVVLCMMVLGINRLKEKV
jgi:integral membrane protein (TIGR01906 family)